MKKAGALIIGGGVIGASIAYHLAEKGLKDVVVMDKNPEPDSTPFGYNQVPGSTGRATGGFRCQFATPVNINLSLLSRKKLLRFKDETEIDPGFFKAGYLFIASNRNELNELGKTKQLQISNGLTEACSVSPEDIFRLNPFLFNNDNIAGGVYSPEDGFIIPLNILKGYKAKAESMGVSFLYETEFFSFIKSGEKIISAVTSTGNINAEFFINAAGAWAGYVSELAGLSIPVIPQRRQIAVLDEKNVFKADMPMTIFITDGFHFRQRDGYALLLYPETTHSENYNMQTDDHWLTKIKAVADERIRGLIKYNIRKDLCWGGLYEVTPDKHSVIGTHPAVKNFYHANGSSGHGVMHSPAIGEIISEIIVNGSFSKFDISPLRPTRFEENDLNFCSDYL